MTGLHCGPTAWIGTLRTSTTVFPVEMTGLHCGVRHTLPYTDRIVVFPVEMTGLHCGSQNPVRMAWRVERSSRSK